MKSQTLSKSYIQLEKEIPKSEVGKIKLFWFFRGGLCRGENQMCLMCSWFFRMKHNDKCKKRFNAFYIALCAFVYSFTFSKLINKRNSRPIWPNKQLQSFRSLPKPIEYTPSVWFCWCRITAPCFTL